MQSSKSDGSIDMLPSATAFRAGRHNLGRWVPPHLRNRAVLQQTGMEGTCHGEIKVKLEPIEVPLTLESLTTEKPREAALDGMDRLVQDLLASRKHLKDEKSKAEDKDAEIARLKEEMAQLRQRDCEEREEVKELRRLLAFHQRNGEQVSRKFRDLQAANKGLQTQLQAAEMALEEQTALLAGPGTCA
ncbi:hypothetical protein J3F83DRAFT_732012 [Trichoderma novae-zelandiae]